MQIYSVAKNYVWPLRQLIKIIHFSLLSMASKDGASTTCFLSFVGSYSLFPLLFNPELTAVKLFFVMSFAVLFYIASATSNIPVDLKWYEYIYLCGFGFVFCYEQHIQYMFGLDKKLPFLPLLIVSVYCSIGVIYFWLRYYYSFLFTFEYESSTMKMKKIKWCSKSNLFLCLV